MTQIVDHGKWVPYQPDTLPEGAPPGARFARRESDGVDWYDYSRDSKNFSPNTVKFTVRWQAVHNGHVIDAATYDITRLFPAGALLREIIDYHGDDDTQAELGERLYDPDSNKLRDRPPPPSPLIFDFEGLEARVAALEAKLGGHAMSDVSGIPNMGFGGGNFFAPQFSYNPQMSAGAASAAYMPAENYAQNVTNNLFSSGGGFGRQTDYYSGLGAQYSAAGMSPYGIFTEPGSGGGGGASPYQTSANVFDTGAAPFQGGGGSSGMGGSIYNGGGFSGGIFGGDSFGGGGRQDPYPNMSMPGGLGMPASSPSGAGPINWGNLFDGGGGPRNDPAPGMSMPGGLGSPMSTPQTQPGINWNNVGTAAGGSMPYTSGIEPDQTGGQTFAGGAAASDPYPGMAMPGGLGSPMTTPEPGASFGERFDASNDNAPAAPRTYDFAPMFEGGGGSGFGRGGTESQTFGAQGGSLGGNVFDYFQDPSATREAPGPSAEALAAEARARLAEVIAKPQIPTTDEIAPSAATFDERFKGDATAQGAGQDTGNVQAMPDMQKLLGYTPQEFTPEQPAIDWSNFVSPANDYGTFQAGGGTAGPSPFDQPSQEEFQKGQTEASRPPDKADMSLQGRIDTLRDTVKKELEAMGLHMTSDYRGPGHELYRPGSKHSDALAFDTRARTPEQADAAMAKLKEMFGARGMTEGRDYKFIDEVRSPIGGITKGPHVHTTLTPEGMQRYQESAYDVNRGQVIPRPPADIPSQGPLLPERPQALPEGASRPSADIFPERRLAPNGQEPAAFVVHHTEGRPTLESTVNYWQSGSEGRGDNLGSQYFLDRNAVIHDVKAETGYTGTEQTRRGNVQGTQDLNNSNVVGIEVSAKNTADMTPDQRAVLQRFVEQQYAQTPVYGHAEIDKGKDPDEGVARANEILDARVAANPNMFPSAGFWDKLDAQKADAPRPSADVPLSHLDLPPEFPGFTKLYPEYGNRYGDAAEPAQPLPEGAARPSADVGTPFVNDGTPFGPPAPPDYKPPAAAPVKHSGLELARANIDTPIERIAMERGGQKAVDQVSSMAVGKTPRELLASYGGMFMSKAEPLFGSLGITRSDFEKAISLPPTRQDLKMRFGEGGDFGPYPAYTGPEAAPGGSYADFRQSPNVEDRRAELANLTNTEPDPFWASEPGEMQRAAAGEATPLARDLGIGDVKGYEAQKIAEEHQRLMASPSDESADLPLPGQGRDIPDTATPPGFFGSDENIANRKLGPESFTTDYNKNIYEATDRPTMARDESLGADPNPFKDFRQGGNVEDRRFDPAMGRDELAAMKARGFSYVPGPEVASSPLGAALGLGELPMPRGTAAGTARPPGAMDAESGVSDEGFNFLDEAANNVTPQSARDALANIISAPPARKTMDFSGGFSPSPEPRQGGVGPQAELTPEFMDVIKQVESSGNPKEVTGKYKGLYQLDDKEFRKYGGTGDIFDPEQNTRAASAKMMDENQRVQDRLGRALTPPEQYMVHNQGVAGSLAHLANPDELAWKNFQGASGRSEAGAKEAIWKNMTPEMKKEFGNDVNNVTSRDFLRLWEDRYYEVLNR